MIPARRNTGANAYTVLMCDALESAGYVVEDLAVMPDGRAAGKRSTARAWFKAVAAAGSARYDVIHLHWPHAFAQDYSYPVAVLRSAALVGLLVLHKLLGARVVWTVHDVLPMGRPGKRRLLTAGLMRATIGLVDGLVHVSGTSMTALRSAFPSAGPKPSVLTRHPAYGDRIPPTDRHAARTRLGLPLDRTVLGFAGDIKDYKGLEDLLEACQDAGSGGPMILVAGAAETPGTAAAIARRVALLGGRGLPVSWTPRTRLSDEELSAVLAACDLIVLPYRLAWNSGMAILALEHGRPVLCRDHPIFRELHRELGERWVSMYDPPLRYEAILEAASRARALVDSGRPIPERFLATRQWTSVIADVIGLYRRL